MEQADKILSLIGSPHALNDSELRGLEFLLEKYPYCQSVAMLYLKTLHQIGSFRFQSELYRLSGRLSSREALYRFIHESTAHPGLLSLAWKQQQTGPYELRSTETISNKEKELREWIHEQSQVQAQTENDPLPKDKAEELIERFIRTNPKIKPKSKITSEVTSGNIAEQSAQENPSLMTETLAEIYLEQKNYDKAVRAYHILSLKYPKKSAFFANRIREIEKNIEDNNKKTTFIK